VIVVLGYRSDDVHRRMKGLPCRVMLNPRYFAGRAGSLRIGAKAVDRNADPIVICNVDQPRPAALIRMLLEAHDPASAGTRPTFEGHPGHPVVVAGRLRPELLAVTEETEGLRAVLLAHRGEIRDVPADAICALDMNTPDEYREALRAFGLAS
jgi:CTP:molybdopterin cytidylyltransferase MocA